MDHIDLDSIDTDGAVAESRATASEAIDSGDTRMSFLRKGALAGGAAVSGGAILGALMPGAAMAASGKGRPPASFGKGDIGILNYALTLEYLESAFYDAAARRNVAKGDKHLSAFLATTRKDEAAHVAALKKALGHKAAKKPKFDFGRAVRDKSTFAATAYVLENTGVHAYIGQAFNIKTPAYLGVALSIVTIEARHSGAIGLYLGKPIAPNGPFDNGLPASKILKAVAGTGFIKG